MDKRAKKIVSKTLYTGTVSYDSGHFPGGQLADGFRIEFDLPEDPTWTTSLSTFEGVRDFWILQIQTPLPGRNYKGEFLIPVFAMTNAE